MVPARGRKINTSVPKPSDAYEGAVAQLGERYNGIVEVVGSIPSGSTIHVPIV